MSNGTRTCGLAIASPVAACGSLLLGSLASIPAVIMGTMARRKIAADPSLGGGKVALAGLIIGWVFTGLFLLFVVLLLVLTPFQSNSVTSTCKPRVGSAPHPG